MSTFWLTRADPSVALSMRGSHGHVRPPSQNNPLPQLPTMEEAAAEGSHRHVGGPGKAEQDGLAQGLGTVWPLGVGAEPSLTLSLARAEAPTPAALSISTASLPDSLALVGSPGQG